MATIYHPASQYLFMPTNMMPPKALALIATLPFALWMGSSESMAGSRNEDPSTRLLVEQVSVELETPDGRVMCNGTDIRLIGAAEVGSDLDASRIVRVIGRYGKDRLVRLDIERPGNAGSTGRLIDGQDLSLREAEVVIRSTLGDALYDKEFGKDEER